MTSIRQRLTRKLVIALLVFISLGLAIVYLAVRTALLTEFDDTLRAKAQAVSTVTSWTESGVSVDFSDKFMRGFDDKIATDFFEMWLKDGKAIERSESLGRAELPRRIGTLRDPVFINIRLPTGAPGRAVGFSFGPQDEEYSEANTKQPQIELMVASDRRALDQTLSVLLIVIIGCAVALIVAAIAVIPTVLKTELLPLDVLGDQAGRIDARSLGNRFVMGKLPSELVPITERLNDLLARLQQSFDRERRFSADLAHELRTPLAELCGLAEYALQWPETRDPTTDKEVLAVGRHMEGLVGRMLTLARSEEGKMRIEPQPVALHSLIETLWKHYTEKASAKGLEVHLDLPPLTVETDLVLFRAILGNLCDNAVEYTPRGGQIAIALWRAETTVGITIRNSVNNFDPADLPRLFERFWRKEASRTGEEHSGLGLPLAQEFAHILGWNLTASIDGVDRLAFRLSGPLAANRPPSAEPS